VAGFPVLNLSVVSTAGARLYTPPLNLSLYQNVSLVSPDGGWGFAQDAMFYTDDCPFEGECTGDHDRECADAVAGWYGLGLNCRPCFEGGICPGGNRVWPQPGWCVNFDPPEHWVLVLTGGLCVRYTFNEYSTLVSPCRPASACLGGRFSQCATGYDGALPCPPARTHTLCMADDVAAQGIFARCARTSTIARGCSALAAGRLWCWACC
jgi:hypothetical protein